MNSRKLNKQEEATLYKWLCRHHNNTQAFIMLKANNYRITKEGWVYYGKLSSPDWCKHIDTIIEELEGGAV